MAHDFMADDQRELRIGQFAVYYVQIGPADSAGMDFELHLTGARLRHGTLPKDKRTPRLFQDHRAHGLISIHRRQ
jgi:hypothetical protein